MPYKPGDIVTIRVGSTFQTQAYENVHVESSITRELGAVPEGDIDDMRRLIRHENAENARAAIERLQGLTVARESGDPYYEMGLALEQELEETSNGEENRVNQKATTGKKAPARKKAGGVKKPRS